MSSAKIPHRRPVRSGNNSTVGEKLSENIRSGLAQFFGGKSVIVIVGFFTGLIVIAVGIWWYADIYSSPTRTFWDMISNNLSTGGVSTESVQKGSAGTNDTLTQLTFDAKPMIRNIKETDSGGSNSNAKIKIESIGTATDTYQHYILIDRPPSKSKPVFNYSKVYPMWIKNGGNGQKSDPALFNDAFFEIESSGFLFGNLQPSQKTTLLGYLANAYSVDFQNVAKKKDHGRKIYTYNIILSVQDYAKAAQYYAQSLQLPGANQINPSSYQTSDKITMEVSVDVLSRQLRQVVYKSSSTTQSYSGYGILTSFKLPAHTVSYGTLQAAVNKAGSAK